MEVQEYTRVVSRPMEFCSATSDRGDVPIARWITESLLRPTQYTHRSLGKDTRQHAPHQQVPSTLSAFGKRSHARVAQSEAIFKPPLPDNKLPTPGGFASPAMSAVRKLV
jgi:hypothetical protein